MFCTFQKNDDCITALIFNDEACNNVNAYRVLLFFSANPKLTKSYGMFYDLISVYIEVLALNF